jgi:Fe-S cluster assembly protein SufD
MSAVVTPMRTKAEEVLIQRFAQAKAKLPGTPAIAQTREAAFATISTKGLPHRRVEAWKYTDLRALMREAAPLAAEPAVCGEAALLDTESFSIAPAGTAEPRIEGAIRIVFRNGYLWRSNSNLDGLPPGMTIVRLKDALTSGHPLIDHCMGRTIKAGHEDVMHALNAAFVSDGLIIHVARDVVVDAPVQVVFETDADLPVAIYHRLLVVLEEGASLQLIESHEGPNGVAYQSNGVVEAMIGDKAALEHVRLNAEGDQALSLTTLAIKLGHAANANSFAMSLGAAVSRQQAYVTFAGKDAKAGIRGGTLLHGEQHHDTTLVVDHIEPGGESRELFRTVLDGTATGIFQGRINVAKDAQKTDGRMASNALLLGEGTTMNNKPELEIFADDVQCAHGATCGALDDDLLFYLMARGLPRAEAEALMVHAFIGEALEHVAHEGLRETLDQRVTDWLATRAMTMEQA